MAIEMMRTFYILLLLKVFSKSITKKYLKNKINILVGNQLYSVKTDCWAFGIVMWYEERKNHYK